MCYEMHRYTPSSPLELAYWDNYNLNRMNTISFLREDDNLHAFRTKLNKDNVLNDKISNLLIQNIEDESWETLAQIAPELLLYAFSKLQSKDDQQKNIIDCFLGNFEDNDCFRNETITLLQGKETMLAYFRDKLEKNTDFKDKISDLLIQNITDESWKTLAQIVPELLLYAFENLSLEENKDSIIDLIGDEKLFLSKMLVRDYAIEYLCLLKDKEMITAVIPNLEKPCDSQNPTGWHYLAKYRTKKFIQFMAEIDHLDLIKYFQGTKDKPSQNPWDIAAQSRGDALLSAMTKKPEFIRDIPKSTRAILAKERPITFLKYLISCKTKDSNEQNDLFKTLAAKDMKQLNVFDYIAQGLYSAYQKQISYSFTRGLDIFGYFSFKPLQTILQNLKDAATDLKNKDDAASSILNELHNIDESGSYNTANTAFTGLSHLIEALEKQPGN